QVLGILDLIERHQGSLGAQQRLGVCVPEGRDIGAYPLVLFRAADLGDLLRPPRLLDHSRTAQPGLSERVLGGPYAVDGARAPERLADGVAPVDDHSSGLSSGP